MNDKDKPGKRVIHTEPDRYFLRVDKDYPWFEVTKERYIAAERSAGFHNTMGQPDEPATSLWTSREGFAGKIQYGRRVMMDPDAKDLVTELAEVAQREKYHLLGQTQVVINREFFQDLITARCKLWAILEADLIPTEKLEELWSQPLGDEWAKDLGQ